MTSKKTAMEKFKNALFRLVKIGIPSRVDDRETFSCEKRKKKTAVVKKGLEWPISGRTRNSQVPPFLPAPRPRFKIRNSRCYVPGMPTK